MTQNVFSDFLDEYGPCRACCAARARDEDVRGCERCADNVVKFLLKFLTDKLDGWQEQTARAYGRGERRIALSACHGPGKTWLAAALCVYQSVCWFPQHVVVTAPSKGQLEDALVKNVVTLFKMLPQAVQDLFEIKTNRIELKSAPEESWFSARTARAEKPEALQGVHCFRGRELLVADEASGVDDPIFESAAGSMSGRETTTMLLSNPTRVTGYFYDVFHKLKDMWWTRSISAFDSSRVDRDFVKDIARRYGEDSNAYRIRVLGQFPTANDDSVIARDLIIAARKRDITIPPFSVEVWGLDVARKGANRNALVRRNRIAIVDAAVWGGVDLMQTAGRVKREYDDARAAGNAPQSICVDANGLGAGVADRLAQLGLPILSINVSETQNLDPRFRNMRTELYWKVREWLELKDKKMPWKSCCGNATGEKTCPHDRLEEELAAPTYSYTSSGKILMESKDDMLRRKVPSPDIADAAALSFADEPVGLLHGSSSGKDGWASVGWNQPLHRDLSHV